MWIRVKRAGFLASTPTCEYIAHTRLNMGYLWYCCYCKWGLPRLHNIRTLHGTPENTPIPFNFAVGVWRFKTSFLVHNIILLDYETPFIYRKTTLLKRELLKGFEFEAVRAYFILWTGRVCIFDHCVNTKNIRIVIIYVILTISMLTDIAPYI